MATYDYSKQVAGSAITKVDRSSAGRIEVISSTIDFTLAPDALAAADIVKFITIPAGYVLTKCFLKIITAATGTFTCDLRDSSGAAKITVVGKNLAAAAGTVYLADGSLWYTGTEGIINIGTYYAAADYIGMTLTGANAGKFGTYQITAEMLRLA